jgi:hypothetical protein
LIINICLPVLLSTNSSDFLWLSWMVNVFLSRFLLLSSVHESRVSALVWVLSSLKWRPSWMRLGIITLLMILPVSDRILCLGLYKLWSGGIVITILGDSGVSLHLALFYKVCSLLLEDTPVVNPLLQLRIVKIEVIDGVVVWALFVLELYSWVVKVLCIHRLVLVIVLVWDIKLLHMIDLDLLDIRIKGAIILCEDSFSVNNNIFWLITSHLLVWII